MTKRRFVLWIAVICLLATLIPATALAATGWSQNADGSWSYCDNGYWVVDSVCHIDGKYYGFDAAGKMYKNKWYEDDYGNWMYFGADGAAYCEGAYQFGAGVYYGFDYRGYMYKDQVFDLYDSSRGEWVYYRAKADGTLYCGEWYDDYGSWVYYAKDASKCRSCVYQIGGVYYGFDYSGYMYKDQVFDVYDSSREEWVYYRAKADGSLYVNEWYDAGSGNYYYYGAGGAAPRDQVLNIGGVYYGFGYAGQMHKNTSFDLYDEVREEWVCYRAKASGALYRNEWWESEWGELQYFGADSAAANDFLLVDGIWYFFRNGHIVSDELVVSNDGKYYYLYNEGKSYINVPAKGWFQLNGSYYYHNGEGALCRGNVYKIDGQYYYFYHDGEMLDNSSVGIGRYDETLDRYVNSYYRARKGGALYVNEWYQNEGSWYYYGAEGAGCDDFAVVNGKWYFFDRARMVTNQIVYSELYEKYYLISADGTSNKELPKTGWVSVGDSYYYMKDGELLRGDVYKIDGQYYFFYYDGEMLDDGSVGRGYYDETLDQYVYRYYRARKGGALYVNQWYKEGSSWYYYGAEGAGYDDFAVVNGTWYFFEDARMVKDRLVYSNLYSAYYVISADGTSSTEVKKDGWYSAGGNYYCVQNGEMCQGGIYKIGGQYYGFNWEGRMYDDQDFGMYDEEQDRWFYYHAKKGGALYANQWYQSGSYWYFYGAAGKGANDFTLISGTWYYFEDARMITSRLVYSELYDGFYVISSDGKSSKAITKDGWVTVGTDYYYILDGQICQEQVYLIDGKYYGFDYDGRMYADGTFDLYDHEVERWVYYRAKADGSLYVNTWYEDDWGDWFYYGAGGAAPRGRTKLDGAWYYFSSSGNMYVSSCAWEGDVGYAFGANGKQITAQGKQNIGGAYVYVKADGSVVDDDWVKINGKWNYFNPYMVANTMAEIDGQLYAVDNAGTCVAVTGNGIYDIGTSGKVYLQNGVISDGWKLVNGAWYYFDDGMYRNGVHEIDDTLYVFDQNGKMFTGGWLLLSEYYDYAYTSKYYVYADASGKAATGLKTIGGKQYIFNEYGTLYTDTSVEYEGKTYMVDASGAVVDNANTDGWKQVGGEYYYVKNGELVKEQLLQIGGKLYAFDWDGTMATNGIVWLDGYEVLAGANGEVKTGWQQWRNNWYYADANGYLLYGKQTIGGKQYILNYALRTGTFMYDGMIITTDASGAIVSEKDPADGWSYVDGEIYYYKNGLPYDGWVGDYLISDGRMVINDWWYWKGDCYAIDSYGKYVKSGWHRFNYGDGYGNYVYAKSGGKLCRDEWLAINGVWYYFSDVFMAHDGIYEINGEYCKFDENGKYLGKVSAPTGDGWQKAGSQWYYLHAGEYLNGVHWIDGKRYVFDWDGMLLTGGFNLFEDWIVYTDSNGAIPNYTGWKKINGEWCYFDSSNIPVRGWLQDNGKVYFCESFTKNDVLCVGMATGYRYISGQLHYFDANGVYQGTKGIQNGWYKADGEWYFFRNGNPVSGYQVINGKGYYFRRGVMVTNEICGSGYFGSDGVQRTTKGWYKTAEGWIFVQADGWLANGVQKINGTEYYFNGYIMIR